MTKEFTGRVVLVTGAGSGIGQSHARHFAQLGATIIVHDRNAQGIGETMAAVEAAGGQGVPLMCDVREYEAFASGIRQAGHATGGIDVLINNVGVPADMPLEEITRRSFADAFDVNLFSFIVAAQAVVPFMKQKRYGRIVNTSSNWGLVGHEGSSLYSATKSAILGLTKSWARELAPWSITVNCIAPAGIKTALLQSSPERIAGIPLKRHGEPVEVSCLVAFLASDKAAYMTGEVLGLSGGELIVGI